MLARNTYALSLFWGWTIHTHIRKRHHCNVISCLSFSHLSHNIPRRNSHLMCTSLAIFCLGSTDLLWLAAVHTLTTMYTTYSYAISKQACVLLYFKWMQVEVFCPLPPPVFDLSTLPLATRGPGPHPLLPHSNSNRKNQVEMNGETLHRSGIGSNKG